MLNAIDVYRVGHWLHRHRVPFLPRMTYLLSFLLFNSSVPPSCEIGSGSRFGYGGIGVVIHGRCKIGKRVMIGQNVTLGGSFGSDVPTVGDDVFIGPGVRIIGSVRIGSNVVLGANAVVVKDIPDNCVAAGVPAKVLRTIAPGSLDAIKGEFRAPAYSGEPKIESRSAAVSGPSDETDHSPKVESA